MTAATRAPKDFGFGDDQAMLRDLARKFLDEKIPVEALRRLVAPAPGPIYDEGEPSAWNEDLWREMAQLGWSGLAVAEDDGGAGMSMVGIAGVVEEIGRHAVPSPLIPTLSATLVLRAAGGDVAKKLMSRIAMGDAASLAITDSRGSWDPSDAPLVAREENGEIVLDGNAAFVQDAAKADFVLASARLGDDLVLCAVERGTKGSRWEADHIHDLTRDQATVHFEGVRIPSDAVVSRDAAPALRAAWPGLLVLVTADLCGSCEWQLQTTVEYAKQRRQFDREIGFFQAVKHPLVDAMVEIDRARSLLYHAACEIDVDSDDAENAARMAKSAASDAGAFISDRSVQLHGGIGFTWECDIHIFFKRSMHNQMLLGDGVHHRKRLADALIGPVS